MEIKNAKITDTMLGREDHGIFTFVIYIEIAGGACCGVGSYGLDYYDREKECRVFNEKGVEVISNILDVVGVDTWEQLHGKFIRVKDEGRGSIIEEIGNLMSDKWINIREFFVNGKDDSHEGW